jgi:hypothetical protein
MPRWGRAPACAVPSNRLLLGTIAAALVLLGACGGDDDPAAPSLLDERGGSYRGIRLGDTEAKIRSRFGAPGEGEGFFPLGESFGDIGGPPAVRVWPPDSSSSRAMRYEGVAFAVGSEGVYAIIVTEPARTLRGVTIGDDLARSRRLYAVGCGKGVAGERIGGGSLTYPTCRGTIDGRVRIWFGEDPIASIAIARVAK